MTIYSHTDSSTTIGSVINHGNAASDLEPVEDWGELLDSSHDGMLETYVKEHGNGDATLTFVTWAR